MSSPPFSAELARDEAVLRFPYDDGLRQLLRAIPGRRWDPGERAWCIPLGPDQAEALSRLLAGLPGEPEVTEELERTLVRRRARRSRAECLVELARPDSDWWLSFATDAAAEPVAALLEHPDARELPEIGRALVPLDDHAAGLLERLGGLRLSEPARRALLERSRRGPGEEAQRGAAPVSERRHDVEFRRDRRGEHWLLVAAPHARLARVLAARAGLRALEGPDASLGLAAAEPAAEALKELLGELEDADVDPRVAAWLERATTWRGNIEVQGPREAPEFVLLGDVARLPGALRERAASVPGGATVALTLENWRLIEARLDGWMSPGAKRCVAALRDGRAAPPAVLERSDADEHDSFVLAPGHDEQLLARFAQLPGALAPRARRRRPSASEHARLHAIRADPFCVPELDRLLADGEVWVEPRRARAAAGDPRAARRGGGAGRALGGHRRAAGGAAGSAAS